MSSASGETMVDEKNKAAGTGIAADEEDKIIKYIRKVDGSWLVDDWT